MRRNTSRRSTNTAAPMPPASARTRSPASGSSLAPARSRSTPATSEPTSPGRCGPARHLQGADKFRARAARRPEEGRIPHPRLPLGRAQEVRQGQGAQVVPVLEALIVALKFAAIAENTELKRALRSALFL